jgi:hypothetical protein
MIAENGPLIGRTSTAASFVAGAMSGFGTTAAGSIYAV